MSVELSRKYEVRSDIIEAVSWKSHLVCISSLCLFRTTVNSQTLLIRTLRGPLKVSVLSGLNLEKMEGPSFPMDKSNCP